MAFVIAQPCVDVKDTSCLTACPVNAIHPTSDDLMFSIVNQLFIDPLACIDCSNCVSACPVAAIYAEADLPFEWQDYIDKANEFYGYDT